MEVIIMNLLFEKT